MCSRQSFPTHTSASLVSLIQTWPDLRGRDSHTRCTPLYRHSRNIRSNRCTLQFYPPYSASAPVSSNQPSTLPIPLKQLHPIWIAKLQDGVQRRRDRRGGCCCWVKGGGGLRHFLIFCKLCFLDRLSRKGKMGEEVNESYLLERWNSEYCAAAAVWSRWVG